MVPLRFIASTRTIRLRGSGQTRRDRLVHFISRTSLILTTTERAKSSEAPTVTYSFMITPPAPNRGNRLIFPGMSRVFLLKTLAWIPGVGHFLQWSNDTYTETFPRQLATDCDPYAYYPCINGLNVTADNSLWTGTGSILTQRLAPSYDSVVWESPDIGNRFGRFVTTALRSG